MNFPFGCNRRGQLYASLSGERKAECGCDRPFSPAFRFPFSAFSKIPGCGFCGSVRSIRGIRQTLVGTSPLSVENHITLLKGGSQRYIGISGRLR